MIRVAGDLDVEGSYGRLAYKLVILVSFVSCLTLAATSASSIENVLGRLGEGRA